MPYGANQGQATPQLGGMTKRPINLTIHVKARPCYNQAAVAGNK